jgi:hypothetical protein
MTTRAWRGRSAAAFIMTGVDERLGGKWFCSGLALAGIRRRSNNGRPWPRAFCAGTPRTASRSRRSDTATPWPSAGKPVLQILYAWNAGSRDWRNRDIHIMFLRNADPCGLALEPSISSIGTNCTQGSVLTFLCVNWPFVRFPLSHLYWCDTPAPRSGDPRAPRFTRSLDSPIVIKPSELPFAKCASPLPDIFSSSALR